MPKPRWIAITLGLSFFIGVAMAAGQDLRGEAPEDRGHSRPVRRKPIKQQRPMMWDIQRALPAPTLPFDPNAPAINVMAEAAGGPPNQDELDPNIDVQITQEIIDKATELGTPLAMYEFVRNECRFQAYYGSQKGSVETLRQRAGNDYDLASLLIALLRSSGVAARYAEGQIEMTTAQANDWVGVMDGQVAGSILFTKGMEGIPLISGPDIVAVRAQRVWVEAYVPNGFGGPVWLPLDPTFKQNDIQLGTDIPELMGFDFQAFVDDYWDPADPMVTLPRPETLADLFKADIEDYLATNLPGTTLEEVKWDQDIIPEQLGLLPNSLPYTVRSRDGAFAEIPASRRYQIRFHLHDGATNLIDHTVNLPEIAGRRVTVDYEGATPADQAIIDANDGIYGTDPATVDLRPFLTIDGTRVATGAAGVGMGLQHESDIHFLAPSNGSGLPQNVQPAIFNVITTGASQAIGLAVEGSSDSLLLEPPADDTEGTLSLHYETAMDYMADVRKDGLEVGSLIHAYVTTGVTSAILENVVRVTFNGFGVPQTFDWSGLVVDADRSIVGVWPIDGMAGIDAEGKDFLVLSGAQGSLYENLLFEERFSQDSVSTIKILELAVDSGITVYKRWNTLPLPPNTQSATVQNSLQNAILSGNEVTFPADPMVIGDVMWTGTAWIDMNPTTGAAGYLISGGANGGATVETWPPEYIDLSQDDKSIVMVEVTILSPDNDSPDSDSIFTHEENIELEFEYEVKVTYDDASMNTLGPYKRKTRNTTKTLSPGNYTFKVWISRRTWWFFNTTIAMAERKVSVVAVLIREDDGSDAGKDPPKYVTARPAMGMHEEIPVKALVIPEKAPDGTTMLATSYSWSGPDGRLDFMPTNMQTTMLSAKDQMPSADKEDQEVKVEVNLVGGKMANGFKKLDFTKTGMDEKHMMTVVKMQLKEVTFAGAKYFAVREDDNSASYGTPQWKDNNDDGDAEDGGESRFPLCYTRNTTMKITAKMTVDPAAVLSPAPKVKADGPDSADVAETTGTVAGNMVTITDEETGGALPNEIRFLNPMNVTFEIKLDEDTKFRKAGTSDNRAYVTLSDPTASPLFETLLDIGCRNATGSAAAGAAVTALWGDFAGPIPGVTRKPMDGHNVADGTEMKYWNPPPTVCQTLVAMLADPNGNGSCVAWSQCMHETLKSLGIGGSVVTQLRADLGVSAFASGFMVKDWEFGLHVRSGPNGINNTPAAGDDDAICAMGNGFADTIGITAGPNGTLDTTAAGDDMAMGTTIETGTNGVCNTTAAGDDVQVIPMGQGMPDQPCIMPGPDGVLNSAKAGDDTDQDGIFAGTEYPYVQDFDARDQPGIPGQSNADPPRAFFNHFITTYGGQWYDPSYGAGPYGSELAHENAAIDGITAGTRAKKNAAAKDLDYTP